MAKVQQILKFIFKEKAQGDLSQKLNIQMRMMMKGLNIKGILEGSVADTPALLVQLDEIAKEFEVDLTKM